jgi:hypothetical protein
MPFTVYYWRVFCPTENNYQFKWDTDEPTLCNNGHAVSGDSVVVDKISNTEVEIKEELPPADATPTQGTYKFEGGEFAIPQGANAEQQIMFSYPITLMNGWFFSQEKMIDDVIHFVVAPHSVIGIIVAPLTANSSVLTVNSTVTDNIIPGYYVNVLDMVTMQENDLGRCTAVDKQNSQISVEFPAKDTFTNIPNVVVRMTVKVISDMKIHTIGNKYEFASKKIGGKYVPANTPMFIQYCNFEGNAKQFVYNIEYLY